MDANVALKRLLRKYYAYEKEGVGELVMSELRLPFRAFRPNSLQVAFRPALSGARWHQIDTEKVQPEKLFESESPFEAMNYIRTQQA